MCATFETSGVRRNPGSIVSVWRAPARTISFPWVGAARREILKWWLRRGWKLVDVPAGRFAVRSAVSEELVWQALSEPSVLRAIINRDAGELRIVTRKATAEELLHFQNERMPVVERALFSADLPATVGLPLFEISQRARRHRPGELVQESLL